MSLYPLKFNPILQERIWGGNNLALLFGKDLKGKTNIGESWELSAVDGNVSVVTNGDLAGNDLQELIEIYMDELVGEKIYEQFGNEFPLLIKLIDANTDLSIQVHPNDDYAREKHSAFGKTEMWFSLSDTEKAQVLNGFNKDSNKEEFLKKLEDGTLTDLFNYEKLGKGDVFFIPAGRVHAICTGCLVAEIQQTSDVTYRIFDYNRIDENGNGRELHLDLALDVMDFKKAENAKIKYTSELNKPTELVSCKYFTTNIIELNLPMSRDYYSFDSFVILMCLEGMFNVGKKGETIVNVRKGETVLIPASLNHVIIDPEESTKLLEIYIK